MQFAGSIIQKVLRFGGEADQNLSLPFILTDGGSDILVLHQGQMEGLTLFLLDFLFSLFNRTIIRRSGGLNDDILLRAFPHHGLIQVLRRFNADHTAMGGRGDGHRTADQGDLRPAGGGCFRNGIAHFSAGAVGDEANRVDRFTGRAGRDKDAKPAHGIVAVQKVKDLFRDFLRFRHPADARIPAGQQTPGRADHMNAPVLENLYVRLGRRVFPHGSVHGRGHQHGGFGSQHGGGKHIVRNAVGHLRQDIGRSRRNDKHVRFLGQSDMLYFKSHGRGEGIHHDQVAGKRLKCQRRGQLDGVLRHDHVNLGPRLFQPGNDFAGFIGGDASAHAEHHDRFFLISHQFSSSSILR